MQYEVKSLYLQLDRRRVHYLVTGDGQPVVGLHGGASDGQDWAPMMSALFRHCRFYAPDLLGYGRSDNPLPEYTLEDYAEFTQAFLARIGAGPVTLLGHSSGGRIAIEVALAAPDLVSKLVLIDTMGFGKMTFAAKAFLGGLDGVRRLLRRMPHPKIGSEDPDLRCLDRLGALAKPVLLIWGQRDPYYPPAQARLACKLLPNCTFEVVEGCRHAPHKEKPEYVHKIISSFIAPGTQATG